MLFSVFAVLLKTENINFTGFKENEIWTQSEILLFYWR